MTLIWLLAQIPTIPSPVSPITPAPGGGMVSDVVWQAIIAALVTMVMGYFQYRTTQAVKKVEVSAQTSAAEVKTTLDAATVKSDVGLKEVKKALVETTINQDRKLGEVKKTLEAATVSQNDKLGEVKMTLETSTEDQNKKLEIIAKVGEATHTLVNSNYGASLLATLLALQNVERLTVVEEDKKAAQAAVTEAQRLYDAHVAKQANVDAPAGEKPKTT